METLYLNIVNRLIVYFDAVMLDNEVTELRFFSLLDVNESAENSFIVGKLFKFLKHIQVNYPIVRTQKLGNKGRKLHIAESQPSSLGNAVGFVLETFGINAVPVGKDGILEYLRMDLGNAVCMGGSVNRHISHMNQTVLDNFQGIYLISFHMKLVQVGNKSFINHNDYLVYSWKQGLNEVAAPFFESFLHDGVVGIIENFLSNIQSLFKAESLVVHKLSDKLRNRDNRVGIVELY